jgi:IclR family acetate operon transcriptional repressor
MAAMSIPRLDLPSRPNATTGAAKALVKGLALVDVVAAAREHVRLTDLVEASGLPRPTTLRLLDALLDAGLLELDPARGYSLGPQLAVWGERYLERLDVRRRAEDLMHALAGDTRETCFLGVREHREVLYVAYADGPQAVRPAARAGSRNPLHSTAIGKTLLAFGAPGLADAYVEGEMAARTPLTITEPAALLAELERIRGRGWAIDDVENEDGVRCVAAPVRDHRGAVVAAMSVAAPAYRFTLDDLDDLAPKVLAATAELSRRIGWRPDEHQEAT